MSIEDNAQQESTKNPKIAFFRWNQKGELPSEQEGEAFLLQEGYRAYRWHDVAGVNYPPHDHRHDECILILDGSITFEIDGEDLVMTPGDRLYLPAHTLHSAKVPESAGVTYLVGEKL